MCANGLTCNSENTCAGLPDTQNGADAGTSEGGSGGTTGSAGAGGSLTPLPVGDGCWEDGIGQSDAPTCQQVSAAIAACRPRPNTSGRRTWLTNTKRNG